MAPIIKKITPWLNWSLGTLFFCYEFMLQVSPSVMVPELMHAFSVNAAELGNLSAFYLYAYAFMQIPVGILLDRFGARRLLTLACLCCALGALIFSSAHTFAIACIGRFAIGLGSSCALISTMYLTAVWFPLNRFALLVGIILMVGFIGAIAGQAPLALLTHIVGWRYTLQLFGVIGILLAILIWLIVRDHPERVVAKSSKSTSSNALFQGLKEVISNPQIWYITLFAALLYMPTPAFIALWGVPFLKTAYHITAAKAALVTSMAYVGYAVGSPFFGWWSDRIGRRKPAMLIGAIGAFLTLMSVVYLPYLSLFSIGILILCFGFFSSGLVLAFSVAREISSAAVSATSLGFVNGINSLFAAVSQPLVGFLLDFYWGGQVINQVRSFSHIDFQRALAILPICIIISLLLIPFIKETYCKPNTPV